MVSVRLMRMAMSFLLRMKGSLDRMSVLVSYSTRVLCAFDLS